MSFFGGDETVYVSSVIYPLGEEPDKIPDIVKSSVIAAGFQGTSRPRAINKAIFDGMGVKLTQGYHYAKNHYYAGLPSTIPNAVGDKSDLQLTLLVKEFYENVFPAPTNTVEIKSVTITYDTNHDVIARQMIETDYSYDFYEEEVFAANNGLVIGATLSYDRLPADELNHPTQEGFRLTFINPDTSTVVIDKWYSDAVFVAQSAIQNRVVLEYVLNGAPAKTAYYAFGGADPRLNIFLRQLENPVSGAFPAIVLKKALTDKKKAYLDEDAFTGTPWKTSAAYRTSKTYGERFDINIDDVLKTLKDNPDEKKVDYAFIQPGTMLNSPNTAAHEYHYRYFQRLLNTFPNNKPAYDAWVAQYGNQLSRKSKAEGCPAQFIRIKDPDDAKNSVNVIIAWRYITYEEKVGPLPKPYTVECGVQEFMNSDFDGGKAIKHVEYDVTKLYLRKRLTTNTYAEITVCGLWHENYVYKKKHIQSSAWAAFNDPDGDFGSGFIIPLEYEVLVGLSGRERLQLAQEAFHLVLNCYKIVKEKWYATGIFKVILAIVAIVVIVLSWGTLTAAVGSLYAAIVAALPITLSLAVVAAVAAVITGLIIVGLVAGVSAVAKEAGRWAAEQWGPAWGAVVQIAATIALTWGIGQGAGALNMNIPPAGLAQNVFNGASMVLAGVSTYTEAQYIELKQDQARWNDYITSPDNPMNELQKLMDEWFPENSMSDVAKDALFGPKEDLDQFLGRTLTLVDGLTYRLILPIENLAELTLTPRLQ